MMLKAIGVLSSYKCNLKCSYCYNDTHGESISQIGQESENLKLGPEMISNCVAALSERGYRRVVISGGEPLLSRSTLHWLDSTSLAKIETRVISNLTLLRKDFLNKIIRHNSVSICVSIGGATEESHNRYRSGWLQTIENINKLREHKVNLSISYVLDSQNILEVATAENYWDRLGLDLHVAQLSTEGMPAEQQHASLACVSAATWEKVIGDVSSPRLKYELSIIRSFYAGQLKVSKCAMRTRTQIIDPYGNVFGCFFRSDILWGNVFEEQVGDILDRIDTNEVRDASCFGSHCLTMLYH